jgi:hypothetical protein
MNRQTFLYVNFISLQCRPIVANKPVARQRPQNNETTATARQRHGKHASTKTDLLLETVFLFSTGSVERGYKEDNWRDPLNCQLKVEFTMGGREDRT